MLERGQVPSGVGVGGMEDKEKKVCSLFCADDEAARFSETCVNFYHSTWSHTDNSNLHFIIMRTSNLSYIINLIF
jgi:hypothetical protein